MPTAAAPAQPAPVAPSLPKASPVVTLDGVFNPMGTRALAIASSTGGPQALLSVFTQIKNRLTGIPIFITQHMPPTFTTILAEHLAREAKVAVSPGVGFGPGGEGFVRFALVENEHRIRQAVKGIGRVLRA